MTKYYSVPHFAAGHKGPVSQTNIKTNPRLKTRLCENIH